jgi:hypothetical protein
VIHQPGARRRGQHRCNDAFRLARFDIRIDPLLVLERGK